MEMTPRSWLFIPGDSLKKLGKADASGADALILDLEDSVAPERKAEARRLVRAHLAARTGARDPLLYVRVNPLDVSALVEAEQRMVAGAREMAVIGGTLLMPMGGTDRAIQVQYQRVNRFVSMDPIHPLAQQVH